MRTIVVPVDFSAVSNNAARYAADFAVGIHASLSLLHVCVPATVVAEAPVLLFTPAELVADAEIKMQNLKNELFEQTSGQLKVYTEVRVGGILHELKAFCADLKPYAVVMGTHGAGKLERLIFGSTTLSAIKRMDWPLIVVPVDAKFKTIHSIGLACDFKDVLETAPVEDIRNIVKDFKAELHVLYINQDSKDQYPPELIEESAQFQEMLGDLHPKYHFVEHENIDEGLSQYADQYMLDLLIVIPKKHGFVEKIFGHSHTKELTLHTHVPLMAVHE
jgi:nucleotide-binding universal stress UspA family protein